MNASYDILQSILSKPPVVEEAKPRTRRQTSRDDKLVLEIIKRLSADELEKFLGSKE